MVRWKICFITIVLLVNIENKWSVTCKQMFTENTLLMPLKNTREASCECGKLTRKLEDERLARVKIAGGRIPWLAELVTSFNSFSDNDHDDFRLCFGTVVSLQTVIFPASCIDTTARKKPKVKLLSIDSKTEALKEVSSIIIHPSYRKKFDNDIAIVKLKHVINFNKTNVVPICLPKPSKRYPIKYPPEKRIMDMENIMSLDDVRVGLADSSEERGKDGDDPSRTRPCRNPYPPCERRPCPPCPSTTPRSSRAKPLFVLDHHVTRTWFYRKRPGYEYIEHFGRFGGVQIVNSSKCESLFPEMLQSKVTCIQQKVIKDIVKQNNKFFVQLELGMPLMLSNTTLVKAKPQAATTKFYLEGIRAPGSSGGIPLLDSRENTTAVLKIDDYVGWISANSHAGHFCQM